MGANTSIQTVINDINTEIKLEVKQTSNASAEANCLIKIDTISFSKTKGCSLSLSNLCSSTAEIRLESIVKAVANVVNNFDNNQKQEAASFLTYSLGVTTTSTNIVNNFSQVLTQKCGVESTITNTIDVKNIIIDECTAPVGQKINFEFINMGTATSICAMKLVDDLLVAGTNEVANSQSQGMNWTAFLWPVLLIIIVLTIGYVIIKVMQRKYPSVENLINLEQIKKDNYSSRIKSLLSLKEL